MTRTDKMKKIEAAEDTKSNTDTVCTSIDLSIRNDDVTERNVLIPL